MKPSYQQISFATYGIAVLIGYAIVAAATPLFAQVRARDAAQTTIRQQVTTSPAITIITATATLDSPTVAPADENAGTIIAPTVASPLATPNLAPTPQATVAPIMLPAASGQSNTLPDTAATTPIVGIGVLLGGIALVLHATRRVRYADANLRSRTALERLAPFVRTALRQQRDAIVTLDQAQKLLQAAHNEPPDTHTKI